MRTALTACLVLLAVSSAQAEVFRPRAVQGAVFGRAHHGRGHHNHHHYPHFRWHVNWSHSHFGRPALRFGYYGGYDRGYYPYSDFGYSPYGTGYYGPGYYERGYYGSSSGAANGLVLGALAGGIIGHNRGEFQHNGWRGAAWGAGFGWILGSVVDANRRVNAYPTQPAVVPATTAYAAAPVTIINNYYNSAPATSMSAANSLFGR